MSRTYFTPKHLKNTVKVRARKTADQGISDATWTAISFPTEDFDTGNNFASNQFVAPVDGYYRVNFTTTINSVAGKGVAYQVQMLKNGSTFWSAVNQPYPAVTTYTSANFAYSDLIFLTAGDTLSFQAYCDTVDSSSPNIQGTNGATFCGFELAYLA